MRGWGKRSGLASAVGLAVSLCGPGCSSNNNDPDGGSPDDDPTVGQDGPVNAGPPRGTVIGWRMDDIQEGYCVLEQKAVIDLFIEKKVPITIGLIGKTMLSKEGEIASYLNSAAVKAAIADGIVEIANHSYAHSNMGTYTAQQVEGDLKAAQTQILLVTGQTAHQYTAPQNAYTFEQLSGVYGAGLNILSSQCAILEGGGMGYCPPTDGGPNGFVKAPDIFHDAGGGHEVALLPIGAVIGGVKYFNDFDAPANYDEALGWAKRQAAAAGYALYMLHPQEFAMNARACSGGLNPHKMSVLGQLLDYYAAGGFRLGSMSKMVEDLTGSGGSGGSGGAGG